MQGKVSQYLYYSTGSQYSVLHVHVHAYMYIHMYMYILHMHTGTEEIPRQGKPVSPSPFLNFNHNLHKGLKDCTHMQLHYTCMYTCIYIYMHHI